MTPQPEVAKSYWEFTIWKFLKKIHSKKLDSNIRRYLRFRDDISVHVAGTTENMLKIIKIITTGFPDCIQFNVEIKTIYGKFLNIKIFNIPGELNPTTTVLRKANSKYDNIPFNSYVSVKYKKNGGFGLQIKLIHQA